MPHVPRRLDRVDARLLVLFNRLVSGAEPWPLFLFGPSGRGKTSAALALCDVTATATYADLESLATATMSSPDEANHIWERVGSKQLAVLDEIGVRERTGDLHYAMLKRFADLREQQAGRVAIFISNVEPDQIPRLYDDRIASRILCGACFRLDGDDRRHAV